MERAPVFSDGQRRRSAIALRLASYVGTALRPANRLVYSYEVARSTGLRFAWDRMRDDSRLSAQGADRGDAVYRAIWEAAAEELGAEVIDRSQGFLEIRKNGIATRVRLQVTMLDDFLTLQLAANRLVVHRMLSSAGLPVPAHEYFTAGDLRPALAFLERQASPCVVKPNGSGGGKGITSRVERPQDLVRAGLHASRVASRMVIERQALGDSHRFLLLDGQLVDVVRYLPPRLTGDGRSTVRQLIAAENRRRLEARGFARRPLLKADLDCVLTLRQSGLTLSSVPAAGATVQVKTVTNQNRLEDNQTVREPISAEVVDTVTRAASLVGLRLAGVDVVTADLSKPLAETGGVIIEVNGTPGLDHHYLVADQADATRVAVPVVAKLLKPQERYRPL